MLFEAPPRMGETLSDLAARLPERRAFVGRELTKLHEEGLHATLAELAARAEPWRGEIVFVVAAAEQVDEDEDQRRLLDASLRAAIECGANPSHIARALADATGYPRRELYQRALELQASLPPEEN